MRCSSQVLPGWILLQARPLDVHRPVPLSVWLTMSGRETRTKEIINAPVVNMVPGTAQQDRAMW